MSFFLAIRVVRFRFASLTTNGLFPLPTMNGLSTFSAFFLILTTFFTTTTPHSWESFLHEYTFDPHARHTHGYDAHRRAVAKESLCELEAALRAAGMNIAQRMVLLSYQQDAIPSYDASLFDDVLNDEQSVHTAVGISYAHANIFGFMTGYVTYDLSTPPFYQICSERVPLFSDCCPIFCKHAFGRDYEFVQQTRRQVNSVQAQGPHAVLSSLINFWRALYDGKLTSWQFEQVATRDVMFGLEHAQHIVQSSVPITQFFIGPDLTYPIEQGVHQAHGVTHNAQVFLQKFLSCLQPVDDQKTAYVFCSFVDGVGKSTLLGNVMSWQKYGGCVSCYERVDNASTLEPQMYHVSDDVVIVDLPSQMSHGMIKPDGSVFVDVATEPSIEIAGARRWIVNHHGEYDTQHGWVHFSYDDHQFVWSPLTNELRVLVPMCHAHSSGLKRAEYDQMIFDAIQLPMRYDAFVQKIIQQLHDAQVYNVVLVDFLNMYPRSSRETIRINWLLQTARHLFGDTYDMEVSVYRHTVHPQEWYPLLRDHTAQAVTNVVIETGIRCATDLLMAASRVDGVVTIADGQVQKMVDAFFDDVYTTAGDDIIAASTRAVERERAAIAQRYRLDKTFAWLVQLDGAQIEKFSLWMQQLFGFELRDRYYHDLWTGQWHVVAQVPRACRDELVVGPVVSLLRANWYAVLSNMLWWHVSDDVWHCGDLMFPVVPLRVRCDEHTMYVEQPVLEACDAPASTSLTMFGVDTSRTGKNSWRWYDGVAHAADWWHIDTSCGVYAYGYQQHDAFCVAQCVDEYHRYCRERMCEHQYLPTRVLHAQLDRMRAWFLVRPPGKVTAIMPNDIRAPAVRLWLRAIATLEVLLKDPRAQIMTGQESAADFIATLKILERITLPMYFNLMCPKPLFERYDAVELVWGDMTGSVVNNRPHHKEM